MLLRLFDKLLFAVLLIASLQIPQLADHYQQYMAGQFEATHWQVKGYKNTAAQFGYPSLETMLKHHEQNPVASVRADAQQKWHTLRRYQRLQEGLSLFQQGSLVEKVIYMARPDQFRQLQQTLNHFKPGLPLSQEGVLFALVLALLLNLLVTLPLVLIKRRAAQSG